MISNVATIVSIFVDDVIVSCSNVDDGDDDNDKDVSVAVGVVTEEVRNESIERRTRYPYVHMACM